MAVTPVISGRGAMRRWIRKPTSRPMIEPAARPQLAVSRFLADQAIAAGAPADRVHVHYQGIDTDFFNPGDEPAPEDPPIVLFVGALAPRKGPQDLIEASRRIVAAVPHRLVLVGEGEDAARLREMAAGAPHIEFAGTIGRDQVRSLTRAAPRDRPTATCSSKTFRPSPPRAS